MDDNKEQVDNDKQQSDNDKQQFEKEITEALEEGDMHQEDPSSKAQEQLIPRYEIRIPVEQDPILEETRIIREMVEEVDDRYDEYVQRATRKGDE